MDSSPPRSPSVDASLPVRETAPRSKHIPWLTWQSAVVLVPGICLIYILSLVPMARVYRLLATPAGPSLHEKVVIAFNSPLLHIIKTSKEASDLTEKYNVFCSYLIPVGPGNGISWWRIHRWDKNMNNIDAASKRGDGPEVIQIFIEEAAENLKEP